MREKNIFLQIILPVWVFNSLFTGTFSIRYSEGTTLLRSAMKLLKAILYFEMQ
jgi:hypothetical protein